MLRSSVTRETTASVAREISSRILSVPTVRRRVPLASSSLRPMAFSTWLLSRLPEVQADPELAQIWYWSSCRSRASIR